MATLYRRGKTWWLRDGAHRESLHTKSKKLARLLGNDYEEKRLRPTKVIRLRAAVDDYLTYVKPFNKASTYIDKKRILNNFAKACGEHLLLHEIADGPIAKYLSTREKLSPYRWNTERQSISALFTWAINRNFYKNANPVKVIHKKKEPRGKAAEILTPQQIKKVHLVIKKNRDMDDAFALALNGGFRIQEIENQHWTDVDLERWTAKVQAHDDGWSPKDYESRIVPLNLTATKIYKRRLRLKGLSIFVFANSMGNKHGKDWITAMSRAMRRAGIKHGGWHRTRHTFATRSIENGVIQEDVREIMGIADSKTLRKYVHVTEDYQERVRKRLPEIG